MKTLIEKILRFGLAIIVVALSSCKSDPVESTVDSPDKEPVVQNKIKEELPKEVVIPKDA